MTNTDQHLINQTLGGDTQSFSKLVEKYQDFVFTIAIRVVKVREEAEEVAQDSFIKAFEKLDTYQGTAKFSSWLYSIVYRKALDSLRKKQRVQTLDVVDDITEGETSEIENALGYLQQKERNAYIQKAIDSLPETEAALITLYYFEDLSVKEMASITALTEDNVKIKLYRSRKKLFSLLKQYVLPEYTQNNGKAI
tara:strand:- start:375 stop:959 length:585 start_codon:yes stop_codon:yes gene_type:complete